MRLLNTPGVYRAQDDTDLLVGCLGRERIGSGTAVLDLGTGSGAVALAAAGTGARVTAVDVSRRALAAARLNSVLNGRWIRLRHGDLLEPVRGCRFDLVVSNPLYVPAAEAVVPVRGLARAWDAGHDGRALVDRICRQAPGVLGPGGVLLMVHSALCGVERSLDLLEQAGLGAEVVARHRIPFGPVLTGRAAWLEDQGLIAPGERMEELVVIRGVR
ncbi:HemK2/MTQ2 family protein methyltransferase [Kitasatospora sp. NPDC096147]|uniref:HemK2/MTQ2 family protein methyltransferase n=1 Tax=Kitasatospora sp. NPDC096147 TaxID=3364093 RepID=UPI003819A163